MSKKMKIIGKDGTKIYRPRQIVPVYETYVVTDNYTAEDGNVYNKEDENAALSRKWVDANHK